MNVGLLNRRIKIQKKSTTNEAEYGTEVITWITHATVWANVQDVLPSRSESSESGMRSADGLVKIRTSTGLTRIRIRYLATVTSDMRIMLTDRSNKILQIVSGPAEMGQREGMEIMAESYTTAGDGA